VLLAGLLVTRLLRRGGGNCQLNAQALAARDEWTAAFPASVAEAAGPIDPESLAAELRKGRAGQKLVTIGLQDDILAAAEIDRFRSVPELDPQSLHIRLACHLPG
jgi:hypothetical protein